MEADDVAGLDRVFAATAGGLHADAGPNRNSPEQRDQVALSLCRGT
ncbi:hypothetical protein PR003_g15132 [Phytophthora rubi]|uniref:Uncharacterized protein n=1 Tax=Phytophthora rubi TaxID=129364 RepID=A0A6A3KJP6_9STRA|nr:hypothetical protein PR002_g16325 [Phytophthora rubi]KAE9011454.1 hypothetical protein PR001_g15909 [Phytophthora rubi]KAE9331182.1 hypothetical protein PR003_g15132 [Phytophthora rubi]